MEYPRLSILICHLKERSEQLSRLLAKLRLQGDAEIITDNTPAISIGKKRNNLLKAASGEYAAFIDDDDDIADDYMTSILKAIEEKPDCVGIEGRIITSKGGFIFRHSIQFQGWYTGVDGFYRTPNHLNPIKRSIACRVGFEDRSFGEDQIFSNCIRRLLKKEVYINHPIYFYHKESL